MSNGIAPEVIGGSVPNVIEVNESDDVEIISSSSSFTLTSDTCEDPVSPCDVAEIFSPPRLCARAEFWNLSGGFSHDLATGFDLSTFVGRAQSWHELQTHKPCVLMAEPPCTWHSKIQNANRHHYSEETIARRSHDAGELLGYAMRCCREQLKCGRGFVFEHPVGATSWNAPAVQSLMAIDGVEVVDFDQCAIGLRGPTGQPIKKRTRFLSNVPTIIETFSGVQCACFVPHLVCEGSCMGVRLSRHCQVYNPMLVDLLLDCICTHIHGRDLEADAI